MGRLTHIPRRPLGRVVKPGCLITSPIRGVGGAPLAYNFGLTVQVLTGTVTRAGFDTRTTGDGAIGSLAPDNAAGLPVEFLFYHQENDTFYFGADAGHRYGLGDTIRCEIEGYGSATMIWRGPGQKWWTVDGRFSALRNEDGQTLGVKISDAST